MTNDAKYVFLCELESLVEQLQRSNRTAVHLQRSCSSAKCQRTSSNRVLSDSFCHM